MRRIIITPVITCLLMFCLCSSLHAQEDIPPAPVVVSPIRTYIVSPTSEFIGTVYYHEVSDVACETSGKVETVGFMEGERVKKGSELVTVNADLLLSDLHKAEADFKRAESLFKEDLLSEQIFDESRFALERLKIELDKKSIVSPFNGVVIKKHVERGEWLSPGSIVATIANDHLIDIIAEVPEHIVSLIDKNMNVRIKAGGRELEGRVSALIQRGDITTRTFPVKVEAENTISLLEGMEAVLILPVGEPQQTMAVPRDAIISMAGMTVVFGVIDKRAKMFPVHVVGYEGLTAGVMGEGLKESMKVVVKGNERLRDGQDVVIQ